MLNKRSLPIPVDLEKEMKNKKIKPSDSASASSSAAVLNDENLLFEVLKHVDAKTLGAAACVSKQWKQTAYDERLWELICTTYRRNTGFAGSALRLVVLALGGFRCLYSQYLLPLSKPSFSVATSSSYSTVAAATSTSSSSWPCLPPPRTIAPAKPTRTAPKTRWGKDEIQLSLSLLSTRYFAKLNSDNINK